MGRFWKNLFLFLAFVVLFYGGLWGCYAYKMRNYSFALPVERTVLVIGDSQTQAAVDDGLLANVANVSQAHDNYYTMLQRLRLYVDANPQIDTVLVALTPHTTACDKDDFFDNFGYVTEVTKLYLPYLSLSDWYFLFHEDAPDVMSALVTPVAFYWDVSESYIRLMGCFDVVDYSHLQEDIAEGASRLTGWRQEQSERHRGNDITLSNLRAIIEYCRLKHITIIGLNTPVYQSRQYMDVEAFERLMSGPFSDVELWDYMDAEIPDSCRRDVNHLNRSGATWFSEVLKARL